MTRISNDNISEKSTFDSILIFFASKTSTDFLKKLFDKNYCLRRAFALLKKKHSDIMSGDFDKELNFLLDEKEFLKNRIQLSSAYVEEFFEVLEKIVYHHALDKVKTRELVEKFININLKN